MEPQTPPTPLTYLEVAHTEINAALKAVGQKVPEIEGFGVIILWKKPIHQSTGNIMIVGATGPISAPDPLIRISMGGAQFIEAVTHRVGDALVALDQYQKDMAAGLEALRDEHQKIQQSASSEADDAAWTGTA